MEEPSLLMTMELGTKGSLSGCGGALVTKSRAPYSATWCWRCKGAVLFWPGVVTVMGFDVMGLPLPKRPIWLNGDGLQLGGWQMAVMEAAAGEAGRDGAAEAAGMVVGAVETYSRLRPVRMVPFVSVTMAVMGCVLFWLTTTWIARSAAALGTLNAMRRVGRWKRSRRKLAALEMLR